MGNSEVSNIDKTIMSIMPSLHSASPRPNKHLEEHPGHSRRTHLITTLPISHYKCSVAIPRHTHTVPPLHGGCVMIRHVCLFHKETYRKFTQVLMHASSPTLPSETYRISDFLHEGSSHQCPSPSALHRNTKAYRVFPTTGSVPGYRRRLVSGATE